MHFQDPVFFGLHCGEFRKDFPSLTATSLKDERDRRYSSLAAAVEFSKANNLLGIFVNADFMVNPLSGTYEMILIDNFQMPIPSLIQDVHATGLVVGVYGSDDVSGSIVPGTAGDGALVDAVLQGGVVNYIEHLLVEPI
jgi:CDK inhibitor PHO81